MKEWELTGHCRAGGKHAECQGALPIPGQACRCPCHERLGPLNATGHMWSQATGGAHTFDVNGARCALTPGDVVFAEGPEGFAPASPEITAEVLRQAEEDKATWTARAVYASTLAGENTALAAALLMGIDYANGAPLVTTLEGYPGVQFVRVGHNSTHNFYAGAGPDGQRYYRAEEPGEEPAVRALAGWSEVSYWGHA